MRLSTKITMAFLFFTLSQLSFGDIWTDAFQLYEQRQDNRDAIASARTKYKEILSQATADADKIRAVSQLGRLALYEGEMLLDKEAKEERKAIFRDCWDGFSLEIKPETVGENVAYYYFRGVCLAYWGEAAGTLASLPRVPLLLSLVDGGNQLDRRFEGGGMMRLEAGVYSDEAARPLGLYDPERALDLINEGLASEAYPGDPHAGNMWFDNWKGKASILMELDRNDEARIMLIEKIGELEELEEFGELPIGREAEALYNLRLMKQYLAEIDS